MFCFIYKLNKFVIKKERNFIMNEKKNSNKNII